MNQLIDAINTLVAERDDAIARSSIAAHHAAGVAEKVNTQLREAAAAIAAALPNIGTDDGPASARKARVLISDERAATIRSEAEKLLIGRTEPISLEALASLLVDKGVIPPNRRNLPAIAKALEDSSLSLIEDKGYLPAGSVPVAQAAE